MGWGMGAMKKGDLGVQQPQQPNPFQQQNLGQGNVINIQEPTDFAPNNFGQ